MATQRQFSAVSEMVVNGRLSKSKAAVLRSFEYSEAVASHPAKVFQAKGVLELVEHGMEMGISDELVLEVIQ